MPVTVSHLENGGILLQGEGIVRGIDIIRANDEIYAVPENIKKIKYQLCDYSKVTKLLVSNEDIEVLAKQDEDAAFINPDMHLALVGEEDLVYGMIRVWEAHSSDASLESMAFRDIEEAKKWLNEQTEKPSR